MATLISSATGNLTAAGTWSLVDGTSFLNSETGVTACPTAAGSSARSAAFTPGVITIDAIAVKLGNRTGTTGTLTVNLYNSSLSADVSGTSVTINCSDLPAATTALADGGWIVFKFSSSVLLLTATNYMVQCITSSAAQISLFRDSTANNWSRALRTTTTQAPVAGDDMIVAGEFTGAGTANSLTVTMDQTATTDYGSNTNSNITPALAVCNKGTLTYGTTASTNYYLKLSGHAVVYNVGTLNVGTTGTAIPRNSTAVLEFDPAADGDMGLIGRNGSTVNIQGLSRTSGKNIVSCKLNADAPTSANLLTLGIVVTGSLATNTNATQSGFSQLDPTATSLLANAVTDNVTSGFHTVASTGTGSVTNTAQVVSVWLARGSGTNNRYVRLQYGNTGAAALANGFYADIDLQAGTIGSCTAVGNGTATSSAITAVGAGFVCTIIGKASSSALSPIMGVQACNASGGTSYAGDTTQNYIYYGPQVFTASALPSGTLTVDTDTGWLSGDVIAVASTSRTFSDSELLALNSNATSTTLPCSQTLTGGGTVHSGTSPTQAEVILLTRNVKIRSSSNAIMAYVYFLSGSVVDVDWAEFYYIGANITGKRGVEVEVGTAGAVNVTINSSSIHDCEVNGLYMQASANSTLTNLTFSSNNLWNTGTTTGPGAQISGALNATNWTFDSNILIRTGSGNGWTLVDVGGTFTNNTVVSAASVGISLNEGAAIGTHSGNVVHSNNTNGVTFAAAGLSGTSSTLTLWRNNSSGINIAAVAGDLVIDTPVAFGNVTSNIAFAISADVWIKSPTLNGDTTFSTATGIGVSSSAQICNVLVDNGDFSTVSGIKTAHTQDINITSSIIPVLKMVLRNTKLGAATEVSGTNLLSNNSFIASQKHDQTAGNHKTWTRYGATTGGLTTDTTFFNTASPSLRMTPVSASSKLESAPQFQGIKTPVSNGATVSVAIFIRKSAAGDGAAYNGNQPRLIQKANPALGQNSDVVLATYGSGTGSWNQLTATSSAATDDGVWEFVIDCDGTAGWINIDDWSAAGAVNPVFNWFNGLPFDATIANPVGRLISVGRGAPY